METNNTNKIIPEDSYIAAITAIVEALDWSVYSDENDIEFRQHSPAGEDFSFSVEKKNIVAGVRRYVTAFDTDEHIKLWANSAGENGVPRFKELVEDAEAIKDMLEDLAAALEAYREPRYVVIAVGTDETATEGPMSYEAAVERVLEVKKNTFKKCGIDPDVPYDEDEGVLDAIETDEADDFEYAVHEYYQSAFIRKAPETLVEKLILELDKADHAITQYSFELMDTHVIRGVLGDIEKLIVDNVPDYLRYAERSENHNDNSLTMTSRGVEIAGHTGTWHVIDTRLVEDSRYWLMESDVYGDGALNIIVDDEDNPVLTDIPRVTGFDEEVIEKLRQATLPVDVMPDDSITIEEMRSYGYYWPGMLPLRKEAALVLAKRCPVYLLYQHDDAFLVESPQDIEKHAAHNGIFGVKRVDWLDCKPETELRSKAAKAFL